MNPPHTYIISIGKRKHYGQMVGFVLLLEMFQKQYLDIILKHKVHKVLANSYQPLKMVDFS